MNLFRRFAALLIAALAAVQFAGCKHTYEEVPVAGNALSSPKLQPRTIAYVAIPLDARHKKDIVFNSGQNTATILRESLARHVSRAYIGREPEPLSQALSTARTARCHYLIYPTLLRWEDRATELTGIRDRVELKLQVIDVPTGETLHAIVLKGTSRWMTDGGDKPQDLLREPVDKYVDSLFPQLYKPSALP